MQVDFYHLAGTSAEQVIANLAEKILAGSGRLLVVADDELLLARLNRQLWDQGARSFLPHAIAGAADDSRQPILLSTSPDAPNLARNILIADGIWRESALSYERAFYLFDDASVQAAREAWKSIRGREGVEPRYWAQEAGKWVKKG